MRSNASAPLQTSLALLLVLAQPGSHALTIGNVRGAVLLGRPVNVTVPVTLDAGETTSSACTEVDISFADSRIDSTRVLTSWTTQDGKGESVLRIQSTVPVDEPVVNIGLRAGCARKFERRFVLLADVVKDSPTDGPVVLELVKPVPLLASDASATSSASSANTASSATATAVVPAGAVSKPQTVPAATRPPSKIVKPASVTPAQAAETAGPGLKPTAAASAPKPKPPSEPVVAATAPLAKPKEAVTAGQARLKLEALPQAQPEVKWLLKSSMSLAALPTEDLTARETARALWRTLNLTPQEYTQMATRLATLEEEAKALKEGKAKVQAEQDALKSQLEKVEDDRNSGWLIGFLGALLVAAGTLAGFLLWRSRSKSGWSPKGLWHGSDEGPEPSNLSDLVGPESEMSGPMSVARSGRSSRNAPQASAPDVNLDVDESLFDSLRGATLAPESASAQMGATPLTPLSGSPDGPDSSAEAGNSGEGRPFVHSMSARTVNVDELLDVQQQAEFFVSLGQHDQAIELLRQHIYLHAGTSGMAHLDLLKIYHDLDRRAEYEQLRQDFNRSFNAKIPQFTKYGQQQRRGLERYPSAIARIEALWKSPRILAVLQDSIFRRPEAGDAESFDLEAYRELVLLFSIAKDASAMPEGVAPIGQKPKATFKDSQSTEDAALGNAESVGKAKPPSSTKASRVHASKSFENSVSVTSGDGEISLPKASPRLALDVNLFELESVLPEPDSVLGSAPAHGPELGPELGLSTPAERASVASQLQGAVVTGPGQDTLTPLDFDLSLPAEFSTSAPSPMLVPKVTAAPSTASLAFDLGQYMTEKSTTEKESKP